MKKGTETQRRKLAELLRELRKAADLRQIDLATKLKKPQSFVSKFESGEKTLSFLELREVCRALGVSVPEFVRGYEEKVGKG